MGQPIKIYVGNIPTAARNSELKELFEKFGKVVECDILKEFAFVHMDDTDAKAAIAGLNDTLWKGARIRVEISTTKTNKGERSVRHKDDLSGGSRPPRRRSYDRDPRRLSPPRAYRDSRPYPDSRYPAPPPTQYRDSRPAPRDSRYPAPRSRPYQEVAFDRRGYPIEPRSVSSRGYPPEYPFHPASYRDGPRDLRGGPGGYDPYSRAPIGYGQPAPYYRGGPPIPSMSGRYDYPPNGAYPPGRQSRYSPPPRDLRGDYRSRSRSMDRPPRRPSSRDMRHINSPVSKKRHHSSASRSATPPPVRSRNSHIKHRVSSCSRSQSPNLKSSKNGHHVRSSVSRSVTPTKPNKRFSSSRSSSPVPVKKRNGHKKEKRKRSPVAAKSSDSANSSFNDTPAVTSKANKENGNKSPVTKREGKKSKAKKAAHSPSESRSRSRSKSGSVRA